MHPGHGVQWCRDLMGPPWDCPGGHRSTGSTLSHLCPQDDKEYVGFATLPNQVHRKSVKKGFDFTLMVAGRRKCDGRSGGSDLSVPSPLPLTAGESGLGKSTLVNSLFLTDMYRDRKLLNAEGRAAGRGSRWVWGTISGYDPWSWQLLSTPAGLLRSPTPMFVTSGLSPKEEAGMGLCQGSGVPWHGFVPEQWQNKARLVGARRALGTVRSRAQCHVAS